MYKPFKLKNTFFTGMLLTQCISAAYAETSIALSTYGLVEAEISSTEDFTGTKSSDISLATVELGLEASLNTQVDVLVSFLYEEDATPVEVDQGIMNLHSEGTDLSLSLGQMYLPFGNFESHMISDPLTLELGEIRQTAVKLEYTSDTVQAAVYAFNGEMDKTGSDDKIKGFGISLQGTISNEHSQLNMGLDFINALHDSDGLQGFLEEATLTTVNDTIGGLAIHINYIINDWSLFLEQVAAKDAFNNSEIAFNGRGAEPSATNVEIGYSGFNISEHAATLALSFQQSKEALELGLPETRMMLALGMNLNETTHFAIEWAHDQDYDLNDGGTDESSDSLTAQLAVEF